MMSIDPHNTEERQLVTTDATARAVWHQNGTWKDCALRLAQEKQRLLKALQRCIELGFNPHDLHHDLRVLVYDSQRQQDIAAVWALMDWAQAPFMIADSDELVSAGRAAMERLHPRKET